MSSTGVQFSVTFGIVLAVLTLAAAAVTAIAGLHVWRAILTATLRAVAQLAVVSAILAWVLTRWGATVAFIALMVVVATVTSARRIGRQRRAWSVGIAIVSGAGPVLALILATGTVPASPIAIVPIAGILIGGAMTATSLSGRQVMDTLIGRRGEFEALLSLGFVESAAVRELCRNPAGRALHPALDQTRTVGLVTLPGAFVGVLLGGGSPLQAGATQLLVLIGLLAAEGTAVWIVLELFAWSVISPQREGG
ncbi:putative ABC transport system permease protein [Hamadaea flava]|uniref:ABC transporter permease n=1 Tax=Hamadaea flava TaxID=1742688 RepID=UPI0020A36B6D|nr:ABC transporter permease [Hamadaea flava]MCP2323504.1 putative ABC transport system permease protein [Hamadaea flava]